MPSISLRSARSLYCRQARMVQQASPSVVCAAISNAHLAFRNCRDSHIQPCSSSFLPSSVTGREERSYLSSTAPTVLGMGGDFGLGSQTVFGIPTHDDMTRVSARSTQPSANTRHNGQTPVPLILGSFSTSPSRTWNRSRPRACPLQPLPCTHSRSPRATRMLSSTVE